MVANRVAKTTSTFQAVSVGCATGGTIALVSYVMQKWLGGQRQIYMEIGLPLSVVSGTLTAAWMCAHKPQKHNKTPIQQVPLQEHSPKKPLRPRKLFGGEGPSILPPPNFQLSFESPQKAPQEPPSGENCSIF